MIRDLKKDNFITFRQARDLDDIGFGMKTIGAYFVFNLKVSENIATNAISGYNNRDGAIVKEFMGEEEYYFSAPLYQEVFEWFINKELENYIYPHNNKYFATIVYDSKVLLNEEFETYKIAKERLVDKLILEYKKLTNTIMNLHN